MVSRVFDSLEIAIITHATKILPELGRSDVLKYPGAPGTELLLKVVCNLNDSLGMAPMNIIFDHKIDCSISCQYLSNLRLFCEEHSVRLFISPSAAAIPSQITATNAFDLAVNYSQSEYVLLWEHDHLFHEEVDWDLIQLAFDSGAKMVRFNRRINKSVSDLVPETLEELPISPNLCRTDYYCNGPFIADRKWLRELFKCAVVNPPEFSAPFGAFVEGPVNRVMLRDRFNLSADDYNELYPIYLYGGLNADPIVSHFGDFPGRRARWTKGLKQLLGFEC